jgi:hypothetical protein
MGQDVRNDILQGRDVGGSKAHWVPHQEGSLEAAEGAPYTGDA